MSATTAQYPFYLMCIYLKAREAGMNEFLTTLSFDLHLLIVPLFVAYRAEGMCTQARAAHLWSTVHAVGTSCYKSMKPRTLNARSDREHAQALV
jgi:hypothetical protein